MKTFCPHFSTLMDMAVVAVYETKQGKPSSPDGHFEFWRARRTVQRSEVIDPPTARFECCRS